LVVTAYREGLTTEDLTRRERRSMTLAWGTGPVMYGLCVALVDSRLSIAGFALIAILYLLPTPRLFALPQPAWKKQRR
jgi:hypothetical protein